MLQRKKSIETGRKTKISLPAAIFNKSPARSSQNSSIISNGTKNLEAQTQQMVNNCYNHPNKPGKYLVITQDNEYDQQIIYCQKCAILLASKGFQVKKLNINSQIRHNKQTESSRESQLTKFIHRIQNKLESIYKLEQQAENITINSQNLESKQIEKIQQYFNSLLQLIQHKKSMLIQQYNLKNGNFIQSVNEDLIYLRQNRQILETMKQDIQTSIHSIVKDTPQEDYQMVMSHYKQNLQSIKTDFQFEIITTQLPQLQKISTNLGNLFKQNSDVFISFDSSYNTIR